MRKSVFTIAPFAVALAAGGVFAYGLLVGGWFDAGNVTGDRSEFDETAIDPGEARAEAWAEYGRTPERTRANTKLDLAPPFRERWRVDAGSLVEFPPVIAGDRAVVGTNGGRAMAIDTRTGRTLWTRRLKAAVASSPAVIGAPGTPPAGGQPPSVLITTMRGDLISLDLERGRERWRIRLGSPIESSPLVIGRAVYIGTKAGEVTRIDLPTRRRVWTARAGGEVKASLARSGSNVVVGDYGGTVKAYAQADGRVVWSLTSPGPRLRGAGRFYAGPAVAYGRVYIGNVNGRVLALSASSGRLKWVHVVDDYVYSSAAVANDTVFVASYDRRIYALDAVTGEVRWSRELNERISGSPSVIGRLVWISTIARTPRDGITVALDVDTGAVRYTLRDGRYSPAVAVKGLLVVAGVRTLYGLEPAR